MDEKSQGIQSIEIAFRIIDSFVAAGRSFSLSEAAEHIGMAKTSLHKYLVSLVRLGVLRQGPDNARYSLGPKLLESGFGMLSTIDVYSLSEPELHALRHQSGQAAALALWMPAGPMIVRYLRCAKPVAMDMQVGFYAPVAESAAGACFAAHLPEQAYAHLAHAECGGETLQNFIESLPNVRANGFSVRNMPNTRIPGSRALACPVFDGTGMIAAALLLLGFEDMTLLFPDPKMITLLRDAARRVSIGLGSVSK